MKTIYGINLSESEMEDLLSCMSIAIRVAKDIHKDSPKFLKDLEKLNKKIWTIKRNLAI